MTIVQLNMTSTGSTGRIMLQLAKIAENKGDTCYTFSPYSDAEANLSVDTPHHEFWGGKITNFLHWSLGVALGLNGLCSYFSTRKLLKKIHTLAPDILHLHNLHKFFINFPLLFRYIKSHNVKVVWTLHDCWTFTGHCPHFDYINCQKWKTGCHHCPLYKDYPKSMVDNSKIMWQLKKKWFCGVKDLTIVTPSQWLASLVKNSFLKEYPVKVIPNGTDLSVFQPCKQTFRETHGITKDSFVLLGVAFDWGHRKGLDVFLELAKRLDDRFRIVLVGTDDQIDKQLPPEIISIHRTQNQQELCDIYSAADILVNPTREDTFPTVNLEALACGTPVLTFRTGGSPETIDKTCGSVVEKEDITGMLQEINRIYQEKPYSPTDCIKHSQEFDMTQRFEEYVRLYHGE